MLGDNVLKNVSLSKIILLVSYNCTAIPLRRTKGSTNAILLEIVECIVKTTCINLFELDRIK